MAAILREAVSAQTACRRLGDALRNATEANKRKLGNVDCAQLLNMVDGLASLLSIMDLDRASPARRPAVAQMKTHMRRALWYKSKCANLQKQLALEKGKRVQGRIQALWYVRAGPSDPMSSTRSISQHLKDFPVEETRGVGMSHDYVARVKDAFAELVKRFNRTHVEELVEEASQRSCIQGQTQ